MNTAHDHSAQSDQALTSLSTVTPAQTITGVPVDSNAQPIILIIEDEEIGRETIKMILKNYTKAQFIMATDGAEAMEFYQQYHEHIAGVLMDIMLPDTNGFDLYTQFKKINATNPVIAFTAHYDEDYLDKIFEYNFFDYVSKPYTPEEIIEKCDVFLMNPNINSESPSP